jgi:beta-phosphoglucomutase
MSEIKALLFDFDGVICDTESQYTEFWKRISPLYFDDPNLWTKVKGTTLKSMEKTFNMAPATFQAVTEALDHFEMHELEYEYIPGAWEFLNEARRRGYRTAMVTSSNLSKLGQIYAHRPELEHIFDAVLTSECFAESKPSPDCFLRAMKTLGVGPSEAAVFEDSVNGLTAGRDSGALVIGLTTTEPMETVKKYSTWQIEDFKNAEDIFRKL